MVKEAHEVIKAFVQTMETIKQEESTQRQETINHLFALRKRAIKLEANASKKHSKTQAFLKDINAGICVVQGHTYTEWEMHNGVVDRTWEYTRSCEICGIKEQVSQEPKEYTEMIDLKRTKGLKRI